MLGFREDEGDLPTEVGLIGGDGCGDLEWQTVN